MKKPVVLVVDDEPSARSMVIDFLKNRHDCDFYEASDRCALLREQCPNCQPIENFARGAKGNSFDKKVSNRVFFQLRAAKYCHCERFLVG